jgi:hypothetical protein
MEALYDSLTPSQKIALLDGPALDPPKGTFSNFHHSSKFESLCYIFNVLVAILATIMVLIRLYTKMFRMKQFQVEEGMLEALHLEIMHKSDL